MQRPGRPVRVVGGGQHHRAQPRVGPAEPAEQDDPVRRRGGGSELLGADLIGAELIRAELIRAQLIGARLVRA
ncbi:hypothetical protein BG452_42845 [Streptomyces sp. CBMA123]|nr:hypothetical protein [Streptomyces sp. CBMA123]